MDNVVELSHKRAEKSLEEMATDIDPTKVSVIDIAATYHRLSVEIAVQYGVVKVEDTCSFDALHPVMASLMMETFDQMVKLGVIEPGAVKVIPPDTDTTSE